MPKKTTILILVLLIFTAGLIYIAVRTEQQIPPSITEEPLSEQEAQALIPTITPLTDIAFSVLDLDVSRNFQTSYSVDISVNTNGQMISGVQLELSYDPLILTDVEIVPSADNLFGPNPSTPINSVDKELGRVSFAAAIGINDEEVVGSQTIATLTFSVNRAAGVSATQISVLPKTKVGSIKSTNSLLRNAQPLNIILEAQNSDSQVLPPLPQQ